MKILTDYSRMIPLLAVIALMAVGINTAIDSNRTAYDAGDDAAFTMIIFLSPLVLVALAVAFGKRKKSALFAAYLSIIIGGFIEYAYYVTNDSSKVMLLMINFLAYWLSGFISIYSLSSARSAS